MFNKLVSSLTRKSTLSYNRIPPIEKTKLLSICNKCEKKIISLFSRLASDTISFIDWNDCRAFKKYFPLK